MARNVEVKITGENKLSKPLKDAADDVEGFGGKLKGFGSGAGAAFTGFLAADGAQALIGFGGQLLGLGQDLEAMKVKSKTVFGDNIKEIQDWADEVNGSMGLSEEAVTGLAANMGDLLKPMGFTSQEAAGMSKKMVGLAGALSAWSGGTKTAAEVSDILSDAMLGETDSLKSLGISISAAEIQQKAMTMTGKESASALTDQEKALATQALILEKSTDAQTAWNDGSMDGIKKSNEMKASWEDMKATLAEKLLPIAQAVTKWIVEDFIPGAEKTAKWINENIVPALETMARFIRDDVIPAVQAIVETLADFVTKVAEVAIDIKEKFTSVVNFVRELPEKISNAASGMWDGITDAFKAAINSIIRAWNDFELGFSWGGKDMPGPIPDIPGFDISIPTTPNIPYLAEGGIVNKATLAVIGEAGPEAVVPLNKMNQMSGGVTVIVQGDVYDADKFARKVKDAVAANARKGI